MFRSILVVEQNINTRGVTRSSPLARYSNPRGPLRYPKKGEHNGRILTPLCAVEDPGYGERRTLNPGEKLPEPLANAALN